MTSAGEFGSPSLSEVEAVVRENVSGHVDGDRHEQGKQQLLAALRERRRGAAQRRPLWWLVFGCSAVLAAGAGVAWKMHRNLGLSYQVSGGLVSDSGYVRSVGTGGARLLFSDGTQVDLQDGARARVATAEDHSARIAIEDGQAAVNVTDAGSRSWFVDAGPFVIQATGTQFNVDWSSYDDTLSVELHDGSLTVSGPPAPAGVMLRAGQRLTAHEGRLSIEALDVPVPRAGATPPAGSDPLLLPEAKPEDAARLLEQPVANTAPADGF